MTHIRDDDALKQLLTEAKVIAVVGYSDDPTRPSYQIGRYLKNAGYTVYAVNPTLKEIDGQPVYATLNDVPDKIDVVDVFRRSEFLPEVVEDAIAVGAKAVWAQLGVTHDDAARRAEEAGLDIVMNRCIKVDHMRLL
jgi:uncharacterized protein